VSYTILYMNRIVSITFAVSLLSAVLVAGSPLPQLDSASSPLPQIVQSVSCENSIVNEGSTWSSTPDYKCPLPEKTLTGNLLVVHVGYSGSPSSVTVTNQAGQTLSLGVTNSGASGYTDAIYYVITNSTPSQWVNVHFGSGATYVTVMAEEFYNVASTSPQDGTGGSCSTVTGTTINSGSFTPPTSGDLVVQNGMAGSHTATSGQTQTSFTAGSGWSLATTDVHDGHMAQWLVAGSGALNPQFTQSRSVQTASCSAFFKAASAGTAPIQSPRIVSILHQELPNADWGSVANPYHIQMPSSGNLTIINQTGGGNNGSGGITINSISDTGGNTWDNTGAPLLNNGILQIWYAQNANGGVPTNNNITLNLSNPFPSILDGILMVYDVVGMAASGVYDTRVNNTGTNLPNGCSTTTCSLPFGTVTPSTSNTELVIAGATNVGCTAISTASPSGAVFDSATYSGNTVDGPEPVDQNDVKAHFYSSSTAGESWSINYTCTSSNIKVVGQIDARAAAFKGQSGGNPSPPTGLKATVN
jgi:hypothetical protein